MNYPESIAEKTTFVFSLMLGICDVVKSVNY